MKGYSFAELVKLAESMVPLTGGTMKGTLVTATKKSAIRVDNRASVSFQDVSGTMFHLFGEGNALRLRHGNDGENDVMSFFSNKIDVHQVLHARNANVVQNSVKDRWLAIEAPETGNPFLSARAQGETGPIQVMYFGKDAIDFQKMMRANSAQIRNDAGLKFSPNDDSSGTTWGLGVNPGSRTLGLHRYENGVWNGQVLSADAGGTIFAGGLVVEGNSESRYHQIRSTGNTSLELHEPGKSAVMMYKPQGTSSLRFCQSNGTGSEAYGYGGADLDGFFTSNGRYRASYTAANRPWSGWEQNAFNVNELTVGESTFIGLLGGQTHFPGRWKLEFGYGAFTAADPNLGSHILNCTDNSNTFQRKWQFRNDGYLEPAGNGWYIKPNGDLHSSRLGGANVVDWAIGNFSTKVHDHTAAAGNLNIVQGQHSVVGSYIFAALNPNQTKSSCNPGSTVPGAYLYPAACAEWSQNRAWNFQGTWMCMGYVEANSDDRWDDRATLWFRVA